MGGCYSKKAGKKGRRNTQYTTVHAPYANKKQAGYIAMDDAINKQNEPKSVTRRSGPYSRGASNLFGFKRRPSSASPLTHPATPRAAPPLDNAPLGRRACSQDSLSSAGNSPNASGKTSPRLSRPGKEPVVATARPVRVNRFGFKSPVSATTNKVADSNANMMVNAQAHHQDYKNVINKEKPKNKGGGKIVKPIKAGGALRSPDQPQSTQTARFTLQTSLLPAPQFPIRLASADSEPRSKGAKTMANNSTRNTRNIHGSEDSSSNGSLNADSGIGSQRSAETDPEPYPEQREVQEIEMLDASPGATNRRNKRQASMRRRELEMVVNGKSFDVRDLRDPNDDPNTITEISIISLSKAAKPSPRSTMLVSPQQPGKVLLPHSSTGVVKERKMAYQRVLPRADQAPRRAVNNVNRMPIVDQYEDNQHKVSPRSSGEWHDEGLGEEEKLYLDNCRKEKETTGLMPEGYGDDWGPDQGEAMAEEYTTTDEGFHISNIQCRPVHLEIEEARFAAIAASESSLIEDERSPVDSLISNSLPTSSSESSEKECKEKESPPQSPGTPTNASNSLSLSEGRDRDFLIDDEIADQPGLVFDEQVEMSDLISSLGVLEVTEGTPTLVDTLKAEDDVQASPVVKATPKQRSRGGSVGTLSPCESITSDDLMMDFDRSEGSAFNHSRVGSCAGLQNMDEASIVSELGSHSDEVFREWTTLLGAHSEDPSGLLSGRSTRLLRSRPNSTPDSPRSLDSRPRPGSSALGSPLRPPRNPTSSESDDGASYMRIDRTTYQQMCQDIVNMKTMLLKLKRLFQENEENSLTMAETLNPFDNTLKNGLFYSLASGDSSGDPESTSREEVVDLRRQAVFLQQQLDERERTVQLLQLQMTRYATAQAGGARADAATGGEKETVNAATQTERIRPVSAGPSLLQSLPSEGNMGPLVSLNDGWRPRKMSLNARKLVSPTPQRRTSLSLTATNLLATRNEHSNIPTYKYQTNGLPRKAIETKT